MTARTLSFSANASSSLLTMTVPIPSARQYPSASLSNVAHGPVLDRNWPRLRPAKISELVMQERPPTIAVSQSPAKSDVQANCMAAALEEQAVSTLKEGPENPK